MSFGNLDAWARLKESYAAMLQYGVPAVELLVHQSTYMELAKLSSTSLVVSHLSDDGYFRIMGLDAKVVADDSQPVEFTFKMLGDRFFTLGMPPLLKR